MLKPSDNCGSRILLDAISNDKLHLARFVLDALDGKIIDSETEGAPTPLISAVFLQDPPARCRFIALLLQRGASANLPDESGRTALSYACEAGHLDAVKILVKNGADPEVADAWGNTALMYATVAGHSVVVEFLVRAFKRLGLQIDRRNKVGNSAAEVARYLRHTDCLQVLQSHSRRVHDGDTLAERLSAVSIGDEEKTPQIYASEERTQLATLSISSHIPSIEEYKRDASSPRGRMFSSVFTSKPPHRCLNNHLPPLFYSPKTPASSHLSILLTPFSKGEATEQSKLALRSLDERYYQKRCSLPTSTLKPSRKSKAGFEHRSPSTLRLLRRLTSPEFKRSGGESPEAPETSVRCIPRSETFPLGNKHPQAGSKPSVDSISAVTCEFDFQFKAAPDV